MAMPSDRPEVSLPTLRALKRQGGKFACLTAYDASFARILDAAGVDVLLVGDSLGMVVQGHDTTLPVTLADMIYHARCVSRARERALVMADMPFMSAATPDQALRNAARLMQEGGAHVVKIEGGRVMADAVRLLSGHGLPVCVHLGLLPQSVRKLGGYHVQGRDEHTAALLLEDAKILEQAGADILLLECVPSALAERITSTVELPVIGIGAGPACDGQVLVLYDMLGITPGKRPRFSKDFLADNAGVRAAVEEYVRAVRTGVFPGPEHGFA